MEFSSARKYSAVRFENGDLYAMGAPEYLIPDNEKVMEIVKEYSAKGSRVVVLAKVQSGKFEEDGLKIKKARDFAIFIIPLAASLEPVLTKLTTSAFEPLVTAV